jgi:hypothetical protein
MSDGIEGLFAAMKKPAAAKSVTKAASRPAAKSVPAAALPAIAKSKNPEFKQYNAYLPIATHRAAMRKYEDEGGKEWSVLLCRLLDEYVAK